MFHPKSIGPSMKIEFILTHLRATKLVEGAVVEIGTYQGATLLEMAKATPEQKQVIGYDTFEGLPEPGEIDKTVHGHHQRGDFGDVYRETVVEFFKPLGVEIVQAQFPFGVSSKKISFAHLDVDFFKGTVDSLHYLMSNLEKGGRIVVDDYGWPKTPGVTKAVDHMVFSGFLRVLDRSDNYQIVLGG